ncbi:MAG: glycosyltransferase 87 family protein [Terracidiphilus sp.]|nr:glycosyltransferase 87 family protein [Terracidiphilus sp.]
MKTLPWRAFAAAGMIALGLSFVLGVYSFNLTDKSATERDYIQYWAAAQQVAHGANPYDVPSILRIEQAAGLDGSEPKVTLSPPLILLLVFPLGFVSAKTGLILWLLVLICCLLASILLIWRLNGSPPSGYHWLGMAFAPAIACLMAGQISAFLLLGVVLFLRWHKSRPWLAGVALLPCVLKPHLFLAVAVVLLLWVISRRAYRILAGFAAALLASCALTLCLAPHAWSQYAQLSHANRILHVFVPSLSCALRFLVDSNAVWLQFLPAALSCVWAVWYFSTRSTRWNWLNHGLLLLLVAALCAPYAFFYDETVLLPAVLAGVYRAAATRRSLLPLILIFVIVLAETCTGVTLIARFYLWTTPAWLAWYLYATRNNAPAEAAPAN